MSFFDDKQEILKVELTTYGRYLISRGKFRPTYYAFFDDDIIYDGEYAQLTESQNNIQTRILDESLSLKPQTTFTSLENNVKINSLLYREIDKSKKEESQISADKNYALSLPLAKSSHVSEYAPAWSVNLLEGTISNVEKFIDNSSGSLDILQPFIRYPQINLNEVIFDVKTKENEFSDDEGYTFVFSDLNNNNDVISFFLNYKKLVLEFQEKNVDDLMKNFDIEVFMEEEQLIPGTENKKTVLKQLKFRKETVEILNNVLLDEPIQYDLTTDDSFVEYYFELTVDDEISLPPTPQPVQTTYAAVRRLPPPFGKDC